MANKNTHIHKPSFQDFPFQLSMLAIRIVDAYGTQTHTVKHVHECFSNGMEEAIRPLGRHMIIPLQCSSNVYWSVVQNKNDVPTTPIPIKCSSYESKFMSLTHTHRKTFYSATPSASLFRTETMRQRRASHYAFQCIRLIYINQLP